MSATLSNSAVITIVMHIMRDENINWANNATLCKFSTSVMNLRNFNKNFISNLSSLEDSLQNFLVENHTFHKLCIIFPEFCSCLFNFSFHFNHFRIWLRFIVRIFFIVLISDLQAEKFIKIDKFCIFFIHY